MGAAHFRCKRTTVERIIHTTLGVRKINRPLLCEMSGCPSASLLSPLNALKSSIPTRRALNSSSQTSGPLSCLELFSFLFDSFLLTLYSRSYYFVSQQRPSDIQVLMPVRTSSRIASRTGVMISGTLRQSGFSASICRSVVKYR